MIRRIPEASADNLYHGSDAGTAGNHCNMFNKIGGIQEVSFWAFNTDGLARFEKRDVFRYVSLFICLNK